MSTDRWTILVCPKCFTQVPYSPMDACHGFNPRCGCTSFVAHLADGFMDIQGGTVPIPLVVVAENPDWREALRSVREDTT